MANKTRGQKNGRKNGNGWPWINGEQEYPAGEVVLLPPNDVIALLESIKQPVKATILDPWYNKGYGGVRDDYHDWLEDVVRTAACISEHVFLWGFPEIVYKMLDRLPPDYELVSWLTWYYRNCPSVIRGWRSAQLTCLHLGRVGVRLYPEHFLSPEQLKKRRQGKLRYMPGPPSVLEAPLEIGWVGKAEQTGHPSQKPTKVIAPLVLMSTEVGDTVLDPMAGSGTTGVVCRRLGRKAILCDSSEEYTQMMEKRLGIKRLETTRLLESSS